MMKPLNGYSHFYRKYLIIMPALAFLLLPVAAAYYCKLVGPNPRLVFGENDLVTFTTAQDDVLTASYESVDILKLGNTLKINGIFTGPSLNVSSSPSQSWIFHHLDTFELTADGWSFGDLSSCGMSTDRFLGGHCKLGANRTVTREYTNLPTHSQLRITARIHFFDQWQGESVYLALGDGLPIWTEAWHWCDKVFTSECMKKGLDVCGHSTPDRLSKLLDVALPHNLNTVKLTFGTTLSPDRSSCDVSYGIDDVALWYK